ncbi:MAG: mechanosensitive ion channel family protein [Cytophagales bacterium]|nr:mechanosensitive ion channel family protein [Cytophagales bacterium]MCA6368418.1 mechanosensitive ion channel family protein [Cytophagales bacterium]MCA6371577.1 mechanosensitive ion channel family protein [Cytophagales bacterium]MCA6377497.1 mechanosensitive ion channel family protein [Cytophagales bacterium]MCA6385972.1 mechanosensitive ion channel family protein [Cytophagales bacterium]
MLYINKYWEQVIFIISVIIVTFIVSRILRFLVGRFFRAAARKLKVDPTRYNFFKNAVDFILFFVAVVVIFRSIPALHTAGTTLLTGAGVLAAIVGFASQAAFSNIISGFFLVIFKPFSVGDRVRIGQLYTGDVEDINLRHTTIKDFENRRVIIPNSVISNETIINSTITDEKTCMFVEVAISLSSNIDQAIKIIQDEAVRHRYYIDNRTDTEKASGEHPVMVRVMTFLDSGIHLRASVWAKDPTDGFDLKCDLNKSIKERFDAAGITLANLHHLLVMKNL